MWLAGNVDLEMWKFRYPENLRWIWNVGISEKSYRHTDIGSNTDTWRYVGIPNTPIVNIIYSLGKVIHVNAILDHLLNHRLVGSEYDALIDESSYAGVGDIRTLCVVVRSHQFRLSEVISISAAIMTCFSSLDFKGLRLPSVTYRPCSRTGIDPLVMWYELKPPSLKQNLRLRKLDQIRRWGTKKAKRRKKRKKKKC